MARARLLELFPAGFEEVDAGGQTELAVYADAASGERLRETFAVAVEERPVARDWEEAWKGFHRPVRVGPLWVGPPWEMPDRDALAVVVDPGRAFGTGAHPTTRLCLEFLVDVAPTILVDLGCGSGVLAIAAAKLGFAPVAALDADEAAVRTARANAAANDVHLHVVLGDVATAPLPEADVALANIALADVERAAPLLRSRVLIASGYLETDGPSLPGWRRVERRTLGGWAADRFVRGKPPA